MKPLIFILRTTQRLVGQEVMYFMFAAGATLMEK